MRSFASLLLLAFAVSSAVATNTNTTSLVVIEKDNDIDDKQNPGTYLSVKLSKAPTTTASVYFEAPGLQWSSCGLKFDKKNWQTAQRVYVSGVPLASGASVNSSAVNIKYKIDAPDNTQLHNHAATYNLARTVAKGAKCTSWGDPHYVTFNGKNYDHQVPGDFYLLKTDWFVVQTRTRECAGKVTCNEVIAIQYLDQVIFFAVPTNGSSQIIHYGSNAWKQHFEIAARKDNREWTVSIPTDKTVFSIEMGFFNGHNYFDITLNVPAHYYDKTGGLCNKWGTNTDYIKADGKSTTDVNAFAQSWRVQDKENLFMNCADPKNCKALSLKKVSDKKPSSPCYCTIDKKTECGSRVSDDYKPVVECPSVNPASIPPPLPPNVTLPTMPVPESFTVIARKTCTSALIIAEFTPYLKADIFVQFCITDCVKIGSLEMVDSHKRRYISQARHIMDSTILNTNETTIIQQIETIQQKYGLNKHKCGGCNGKGFCSSNACICDRGYTGKFCEIDNTKTKQPAVDDEKCAEIAAQTAGNAAPPENPSKLETEDKGNNAMQSSASGFSLLVAVALIFMSL